MAEITNDDLFSNRLREFKSDLQKLEPRHVVQKHITLGDSFVLDRGQHFALRQRVAIEFDVHPNVVVIVGSAKLGFSIKPARRYGKFCDTSDIDIALVSPELFIRYWRGVLKFVDSGEYWPKADRFREKLFDGWVRPDLMPPSALHAPTSKWWDFFRGLTSSGKYGRYKIAAGIYSDWDFLERYQLRAVEACRDEEARAK